MLECGDKIGDYTLARFLGRGQFGEVWLAEKELAFSTRKFQHALKFLFNLGDEINLKSAEAEIDTWIEASGHPNVMSVLDMIVHKEHIIIASEYAEGGSLKGWLTRSGGTAPSHEKALEMMKGILRGIGHLHSRNVVHRDLKPDNILLQGNFPRITDFGISRIVSAGSMSTVAMGSPFYMSPESFDGSKSTQTDIWSAGVILYEMLTGEHPYRSDTIYGLVSAIRTDAPKPLPANIPPELRQIVETALQKDLSKRYQTAQHMLAAVEQGLHNLKVRLNSLPNFSPAAPIDPSAATLVNVYFEGGVADKPIVYYEDKAKAETPPPDIGRVTNLSNVEETIAPRRAPDKVEETPVPEAERRYEVPPQIEWSQETQITEPKKPQEAPPIEAVPEFQLGRSSEQVIGSASNEFGQSRSAPTKKPLLVIGVVASVLTLGLVLGVVAVIVVGKMFLFPQSPAAGNSVSANTTTSNTAVSQPKPNPAPDGMAFVPGGEFTMGRDNARDPEEKPAHKATVQPFFMDVYEVTNEEYAEFVRATNQHVPQGWKDKIYRPGEGKLPVVGVNWDDADAYAEWKGKRLPTEQEWEFAARGDDGRLYPWGNDWTPKFANADGASKSFAEVGKYTGKSPFGMYDMVGNAAEWTADDFRAYPNGTLSSNYAGKENLKTVRGNSYDVTKDFATTTNRFGWAAKGAPTYGIIGFRCSKGIGLGQ